MVEIQHEGEVLPSSFAKSTDDVDLVGDWIKGCSVSRDSSRRDSSKSHWSHRSSLWIEDVTRSTQTPSVLIVKNNFQLNSSWH